MADRIQIGKKIRFDVFKRDGFTCQYCGRHPPEITLEVDHIIPISANGPSIEANLVTACFDCNRGKAAEPLSVTPKSLEDRAAEITEREEQLEGYRNAIEAHLNRVERDMWLVAAELCGQDEIDAMPRAWVGSIKTFLKLLPLHEVIEAAEIAYGKMRHSEWKRFKYFCGICWRKIKGFRQEDEETEETP